MATKVMKRATKDLPPDITIDILSRLRVKTLCRFRSVSKSWSALISDPVFIESHRRRSEQNPTLLVATGTRLFSLDKDRALVDELTLPLSQTYQLWLTPQTSTCLDLVCVYYDNDVCVCNPATRELVVLPERSRAINGRYIAFGRVPATDEFKVLHIYYFEDNELYEEACEVFTMGRSCDGGWRAVRRPPLSVLSPVTLETAEGAFANGAIYMLPAWDTAYTASLFCRQGIARFDLAREEWSVLRPPQLHCPEPWRECRLHLSQVGGELCLMGSEDENYRQVGVWLLKDHVKGMWEKAYSIVPSSCLSMFPVAIEEPGRILMQLSDDSLQYFDLKGKKCGSEIRCWHEWMMMSSSLYVESFRPLRSASRPAS